MDREEQMAGMSRQTDGKNPQTAKTPGQLGADKHPDIRKRKEQMPDTKVLYDLADFFKVIGDGTRIQLLWALQEGEMCVGDMSELLNMTTSAVSHQLRALRAAKLVRTRREGKSIFYALDDDHVEGILELALEHLYHK